MAATDPGNLALLGKRSDEHARDTSGPVPAIATASVGEIDDRGQGRSLKQLPAMLFQFVAPWMRGRHGASKDASRPAQMLAADIQATLGISQGGEGGRFEARCSGRARILGALPRPDHRGTSGVESTVPAAAPEELPLASDPEPLEARHPSSLPVEGAAPFAWVQVVDGRGTPVSDEVFLGHGSDLEYRLHARLGTLAAPLPPEQHEPPGRGRRRRGYAEGMWVELLHGLHARLMLRTYRDSVGPRFHGEALMLPLLPAGHVVWLARRPGSRRMRDRFE